MFRFLLILAAIVAFVWFGLSQLPLGFVLRRLPLNALGVQWTQDEGTVWNGRMMGVYLNGQPVGDVDVALQPLSFLSLKPTVDIQWGGAGGRGAGSLSLLGEEEVEISDLRMEQFIVSMEGLAPQLRQAGGSLRLSDTHVRIDGSACRSASGRVSTDTLALAARNFGRDFSDLTGTIACEDGAFRIDLRGEGNSGDVVSIRAAASLLGQSDIRVAVSTRDDEIETLLARSGFAREDDLWTYRRTTGAGGFPG